MNVQLIGSGNVIVISSSKISQFCRTELKWRLENYSSEPNPTYYLFLYSPWANNFSFYHFYYLNAFKKSKDYCFMTHENYMIFMFWCPYIKFYWNTTIFIHLHIICGYFCINDSRVKLQQWPHDSQSLKYLLSCPLRKSLPTQELKIWRANWSVKFLLSYLCLLGGTWATNLAKYQNEV